MRGDITMINDVPIEFATDEIRVNFKANDTAPAYTISIPMSKWEESPLLHELGANAMLLYELIESSHITQLDSYNTVISHLPQWQDVVQVDQMQCTCAVADCEHILAAKAYVVALWEQDIWFGLRAVGWDKGRINQSVFGSWAAAQPLLNSEQVLEKLAGPPAKAVSRSSSSSGIAEWLADMADQGHLHIPGPQLNDIQISLSGEHIEGEVWQELLPGVKGVSQTLSSVIAQTQKNHNHE